MAILASIGLMDIFIGFNSPIAIGIIKELYKKAQNRFSLIILIVLLLNSKSVTIFSKSSFIRIISDELAAISVPELRIYYRNQNGIENCYDYNTQRFTDGTSYANNQNGNLTTIFDLASTLGVLPASIGIVYNTNDVVLNHNTVYGKGYKLTLDETIEEVTISGIGLLEYNDGDGTSHYFYENEDDHIYYDEDGLDLKATKDDLATITITDKNGNTLRFTKSGNI